MKESGTMPSDDLLGAQEAVGISSEDEAAENASAADSASPDELNSLLRAYAPAQNPHIVDQYTDGLCVLLGALRSNGFDTTDLQKRLSTALRDKDTGGYVNLACELAAVGHFLKHFPDGFRYQVPNAESAVGSGVAKNFDYAFVVGDFSFHVEVKAFAPKATFRQRSPIKVFLPPDQREELYEQGARFSSNCAPGIARFLKDANDQLTLPSNGLSVMLLCCNDLDEFADALTCFVGPHGICYQTEQQGLVPAPSQLPNIDAVVICQLGFNQCAVLDPMKLKGFYADDSVEIADGAAAWEYTSSLPIGVFLRKERPSAEIQAIFGSAFRSLHANIYTLMQQNGDDAQQALFSIFNVASNRK
ncbi:TPA: hypothetical protein QDB02_005883 [Burkholderia vietnamiensis]|nr:hypothetical protein [Burkholderia vietnamiensis]